MPINGVRKYYYTVIDGRYRGKKVWGFGFSPFDNVTSVYDDNFEYVIHDPVIKLRLDKEEVLEFSQKQMEVFNAALKFSGLINIYPFCEDQ